ncbi:MAG TPA: LuxR C-terminal-related transcriptional regulator [Steroidobacteraceae bacterium]|nr:LuxR C-terminal-related transcriptional regulator [Steroidobacteraceae bacterium]
MQRFALTKLSVPVTRSAKVARPALATLLSERPRRLTLVTAPAGFGKTSFAAQRYLELRASGSAAVWISLGIEERDSYRFLSLLIEATRQVLPSVGHYALKLLESSPDVAVSRLLTSYVNDLVAAETAITIFLDDYQLAESPQNNEALDLLLRLAPNGFAVVLTSRISPAISLAALRVSDLLTEITHEELKFSVEETADFVKGLHGIELSRDEIRLLKDKTEGWVAGLQLATLALKKRKDRLTFIRHFNGSFREVSDYLFSDVLCQQDEATREFLFRTSVLERMSAGLCNALTGRSDGQRMLEQLEACNLFVVPLDEVRGWYRYHHLFREFLRHRTLAADPQLTARLLEQASLFCEKAGLDGEAVTYALEGGATERAATLVTQCALLMIYRGHIPQLVSWLKNIPDPVALRHPRLMAIRCWTDFHVGRSRQADQILDAMEAAGVAASANDSRDAAARSAEIAALRVGFHIAADRLGDACATGWPLLRELGDRYPFIGGTVANMVAMASIGRAEFASARRAIALGIRLLKAAECPYGMSHARIGQGWCALAVGDVGLAERSALEAKAIAAEQCGERSYPAMLAACLHGAVAYESGAIESAAAELEENLPLIRECGTIEIQRAASVALARLQGRLGDFSAAHATLDELATCQHEDAEGATRALILHERIRLFSLSGESERAVEIWTAAEVGSLECDRDGWDRVKDELILAWVRLQLLPRRPEVLLRRPEGLPETLQQSAARASAAGYRRKLEEIVLLLARAHLELGSVAQARSAVLRLWKSPQDCLASTRLLEESEGVRDLLARALNGSETSPIDGDMAACDRHNPDSLSARELEVLSHLAAGSQTRLIATDLAISENTVKWHVRNIMEKFGVSNRLSAVAHARKAGLLP